MNATEKLSNELRDIKQMMERSSRFISLSGLSGISAGICALIGAWFARDILEQRSALDGANSKTDADSVLRGDLLNSGLLQIAVLTFMAAVFFAFIFTYRRSRVTNVPIWGAQAQRVLVHVAVPMIAGGIFLLALLKNGVYDFIAPGCLIFYGLGVLNASKFTLPETKWLGYSEILLGIINLFFTGQGLYFWAVGFGVLHIIYGAAMWSKYERN
ncbi:MAG TPA: hypothetical protein VEV83_04500 [Parafilimonas sp.]|nr:hypothetical protein [Parafilimonas sp.]